MFCWLKRPEINPKCCSEGIVESELDEEVIGGVLLYFVRIISQQRTLQKGLRAQSNDKQKCISMSAVQC